MAASVSAHPLAQGLIRIGDDAIARENDDPLRASFAEGDVFHGPQDELDFAALRGHSASLRAAFTDVGLVREHILAEGDSLAARTGFSGVFTGVFTQSPIGPIAPHGRPVEWDVIGLVQDDAAGRLAEEWVQTDNRSLLQKLGAASG